jgi:TRAP-type C4-dicarboxylate transport system substrate-binding protein
VKLNLKLMAAAAGAAAMTAMAAPAARAETTLTLVYPFPDQLIYTKLCKQLIGKINAKAKGVIKVEAKPFNSIKMFQQPTAVSKGVVDIACTPAAFYARAIPENEAFSTSNSSPAKVRANGGMKMMDALHQKYMNMKYLGWTASGGRFRIYLKNAPKWTKDGLPDLRGIKMRDNPIYGAFFRALHATTHNMPSTEVYPALEKGVVNASAWATIGLKDFKWDKFLRHAIEPNFYQTDIGWIMNLDKWKSLSPAAQKMLQDIVIQHEGEARATLQKMAAAERATLIKEGMKFHTVPNAKAYLDLAVNSAYARMTERLKKAGRDTSDVAKLRADFIE